MEKAHAKPSDNGNVREVDIEVSIAADSSEKSLDRKKESGHKFKDLLVLVMVISLPLTFISFYFTMQLCFVISLGIFLIAVFLYSFLFSKKELDYPDGLPLYMYPVDTAGDSDKGK